MVPQAAHPRKRAGGLTPIGSIVKEKRQLRLCRRGLA